MNVSAWVKTAVTAAGAICGYVFGGWSMLLQTLLVIVIADYATGFIASGVEGKLSSRVGFRGLSKKVLIFVMVAVGHAVDNTLGVTAIRDAVIFFYLWNELLSILENAGRAGLPIPDALRRAVEVLKGKGSGE